MCGCQVFLGCEISFPSIDSRLKQAFVFSGPPEVVNFHLKSLLETTFAQSKQICSFDDGDTHTHSIDLLGVESAHSAIEVNDSQMKPETPNASHATLLARNANENPSSETSQPLTISSLAVGRFAAKKGSLRSPRGRLVTSLAPGLYFLNFTVFPNFNSIFQTFSRSALENCWANFKTFSRIQDSVQNLE